MILDLARLCELPLAAFPTRAYSVRTVPQTGGRLRVARTRPTPLVDHNRLLQPGHVADAILVDSPAWYAWLAEATSFAFRSAHGTFTAHKERRGPTREYWKAYRHRAGRLWRIYLGRSPELTLERLNAVAADLAAGGQMPQLSAERVRREREVAANVGERQILYAATREGGQRATTQGAPRAARRASAPALDGARSLHLLATKLAPPAQRANLVPRPRLAAQIDAAIGQGQRVVLVSAPAGFGKTTAVMEWLGAREALWVARSTTRQALQPGQQAKGAALVAWLSLDEGDNQLSQFLAYMIAAIESARPGIGGGAWALLRGQAAHPPIQAILTTLLNALGSTSEHLVLVLDDYHAISLPAIHEAIAWLVDHVPPQMHVIMISRADPPLPLARLRVRAQLAELRAADLRFTPAEATHLFERVRGIQLPAEAIAALEARTEGWVAGLQLAAISLQQQDAGQAAAFIADFTGSHTYLFDYLADEVFQHQPERVRLFLMQTAILARMHGELCATVTGQGEAQALLEYLDQANLLLVRLDSHRHWYRYHHLFRDFLLEQLRRTVDSPGRAALHRRASAWFEQRGLAGEAIEHALSAASWEDTLRCIAPLMADERFYEYYLDWPRWLLLLPDAALEPRPDICLRLAWILMFTGHAEATERPLRLAEAAWRADGSLPRVSEVLSYRALVLGAKGEFRAAAQVAHDALEILTADDAAQRWIPTYVLGNSSLRRGQISDATEVLTAVYAALRDSGQTFVVLGVATDLARAYQLQGQLRRAADLCQEIILRAGRVPHQQVPAASFCLGTLAYEWGDLAQAEQLLGESLAIARRIGRERYWASAFSMLARALWARGELAQAITTAEQAVSAAQSLGHKLDLAEAEAQLVWLWLVQGDLAAAARWADERDLIAEAQVPYERQIEYLLLARIRVAQERQAPGSTDLAGVLGLLGRLRQAAEADGRTRDMIEILALAALAYAAQHMASEAEAMLMQALAQAEPEGYIRIFVDEGAPMLSALQAHRVNLLAGDPAASALAYCERLLAAFEREAPIAQPVSPRDLLSERERTVLGLLADGRSAQEVATQLVMSIHTVRTHIKHIYAKLEAHNRIEAIARARALRLL
jgi:LuxR family transcriptional regulator, maltose regulon positive regulatory protein